MVAFTRITLLCYCMFFICGSINAKDTEQLITGNASIELSGPATKEMSLKAETEALEQFRRELLIWINKNAEISIDTNNAIQQKSLSILIDSCRRAAKSETAFQGKLLTLTYVLTAKEANTKLQQYNTEVDSLALKGWENLKTSSESNNAQLIYSTGIKSLYYALAHLGPPISNPEIEGRDLAEDISRILQKFFDRIRVSSSGMILAGKNGLAIKNPPTITVLLDSVPFPGITLAGKLQNGAILFSRTTDDNGQISFDKLRVPFAPNGTLLEVFPNVAPQLGFSGFLNPAHFGIKYNQEQVQTFIFKVTRPTYSLKYNATSASTITMPPEFADAAHVKKFLRDSCYLKENKGKKTDLAITLNTQVSSYTYDATEEIGVTVNSKISVDGLLLTPKRSNSNQFKFEKRYNRYKTLPYGLFFWEANGKLREAIKSTIAGL